LRALKSRAKFAPYIAGDELTLADCAAAVHLPLVTLVTRRAFGSDYLEAMPQVKPYLEMVGKRPAFLKAAEARKAAQAAMAKK
jgi:glutathione S-transferase